MSVGRRSHGVAWHWKVAVENRQLIGDQMDRLPGCRTLLPAIVFIGSLLAPFTSADIGEAEPFEQIETYRQFAMDHPGDATLGERLFASNKQLVCENCHRITGAEKSGPNLDGIADKYSRAN